MEYYLKDALDILFIALIWLGWIIVGSDLVFKIATMGSLILIFIKLLEVNAEVRKG